MVHGLCCLCSLVRGLHGLCFAGVYVDITRNLTYYINNRQVSEEIMQSFERRSEPGVIGSYTDGSFFKASMQDDGPAIHVALYADEADPMNPLGSVS